ncbi:MAG: hypothetical protein WD250_06330 [Egibacteraceae bacterium]
MSERTRASANPDRTRTDIDDEPKSEWVEPAVDDSMDRDALSGSHPEGDQVTAEMADKAPWDSDKDDFGGRSDPDKKVNEERPHSPRSSTQR